MNALDLLAALLAPGTFRSWDTEPVDVRPDPGYAADLAEARRKTGLDESVVTGEGLPGGRRVAVAACEFGFLGGSIGVAAGERLARAVERATAERLPADCPARLRRHPHAGRRHRVPADGEDHRGGRRAQSAHLPYLVYLRHPTTGGVLASWGSLGHLTLAEPGPIIGFLGPRVYQALSGSRFPEGVPEGREPARPRADVDAVVAPGELAALVDRVLNAITAEPRRALPRGPAEISGGTGVEPVLRTRRAGQARPT